MFKGTANESTVDAKLSIRSRSWEKSFSLSVGRREQKLRTIRTGMGKCLCLIHVPGCNAEMLCDFSLANISSDVSDERKSFIDDDENSVESLTEITFSFTQLTFKE